jgi:hypothetical protein
VKDAAHLRLVAGGGDGFPVRFAFVASSGMQFNGATASFDSDMSDESTIDGSFQGLTNRFDNSFKNAFVPFNFELRAHYNRFMLSFGHEFGLNTRRNHDWIERYHLPKHQSERQATAVFCHRTSQKPPGPIKAADGCESSEMYHVTHWNRYVYLGVGGVFLKDASIGFGPRLHWRNGYTNLPHAWQSTLHFGWAIEPNLGQKGNRFRPMIDADFRGGFSLAAVNSVQRNIARGDENLDGETSGDEKADNGESITMPVFGLNVGVGFTF